MANTVGLCAGCRNKISNKDYLSCGFCKLKYDLPCANIPEKRFSTMSIEQKNKWKCYSCRAKQPKTDNSKTPLRPDDRRLTDSPSKARNSNDSPPIFDNITQRKKTMTTINLSNEDTGLQSIISSPLSKEDIREIIRDELNAMRSTLTQELKETLKQMVKSEIQSMKNEISTLESSVKFLDENYESTKTEIATYKETVGKLQKENAYLNNTLKDFQIRLQIMEQHNRSNNIEIQCIPEHRQENLISTVMQLAKVVSCNLKETDIHHCTRVAKTNKDDRRPRSVIVKLATPRLRDTFLSKIIIFNKENSSDKINTSHIGIAGNKTPIYILEHLSPLNKKLHAAARQIAKEKGYKFVWIRQGRVFMRKKEEEESIYIRNEEALDKLQ